MKKDEPIYKYIARYIILKFQNGDWKKQLPSIGSLAIKFNISKSYVQKIYEKFSKAGYVISKKNQGYFFNYENQLLKNIFHINLNIKEILSAPKIHSNTWIFKDEIIERFQNNLKLKSEYRFINKSIDSHNIEIYFNVDDIEMNKIDNLLRVYAQQGIALSTQVSFYLNNVLFILLIDEFDVLQCTIVKKYNPGDIRGYKSNKLI